MGFPLFFLGSHSVRAKVDDDVEVEDGFREVDVAVVVQTDVEKEEEESPSSDAGDDGTRYLNRDSDFDTTLLVL